MPTTKRHKNAKLPGRFEDLVALIPLRAIFDDVHPEASVEMIDALMANDRLTKGQASYMETLVQLVQAYETSHHAIDVSRISGLDSLNIGVRNRGQAHSPTSRDTA